MAKVHSSYRVNAKADIDKWSKELTDNLKEFEANVAENMEKVLDIVEETAMILVPVDTGATKRSFYREVQIDDKSVTGIAGFDKNGELDYVPLIHENPRGEFHKETAEDRFLSKAFEKNTDKIARTLKGD